MRLGADAAALHQQLTGGRPLRIRELIQEAAKTLPPLAASPHPASAQARFELELSQAMFLSQLLADPQIGRRMIADMQRPLPTSALHLETFQRTDRLDLGRARVERTQSIAQITLSNPAYLNAEDQELVEAMESCVDVALLDPRVTTCVLRGDVCDHPKYRGRRVFCSGINLTHLYEGRIPYLYFVERELGLVNKIYRGLIVEGADQPIEKLWVGVVDTHAIGGGCQLLLVLDFVIAERGSYLMVPARNEGFIPGAANLRLARFLGPRTARRLVYLNERLYAGSSESAGLVDQVVDSEDLEGAVSRLVGAFGSSGLIGFAANRRALRHGEEPEEQFQSYMAAFALEQARCLASPQLRENLERHWIRRKQRP